MADGNVGISFVVVAKCGKMRVRISDKETTPEVIEDYLPDPSWHAAGAGMLKLYRGTGLLSALADMTKNDGDDDTLYDALAEIILDAFRAGREYERRDPVTITPDPEVGSNLFEVECLRCGEDYTARGEEEANAHAQSHRAECDK